ncbi:GFA family protein [Microbulbifer echini]|uniref:GFA family protein n=1 Tax=Microbulbifer echini TaxID=1529067 RepID=A0ABV4NHS8_9GAMM
MRFRAAGQPHRVSLCSCSWCRKRTGSLIGVPVYFDRQMVKLPCSALKTHRLESDAGRWIECGFCTHCGGALTWTLPFMPVDAGQPGAIAPSAVPSHK